ncbi:MAG: PQQ-binding-like beta-propeller repeat protein [Streptosporangiaceae bacterium]
MTALRRATVLVAAGALALMGLAGPAGAQVRPQVNSSWAQFQGNAAHTGDEPGEDSVTAANVDQLSVAWTMDLSGPPDFSQVAVSGGVAYLASGDTVTAIDVATGAQVWQTTLPGDVSGTPAMDGGLLLLNEAVSNGAVRPRYRYFVVALSTVTGAMAWKHHSSTEPFGSITVASGRAYLSTGSQVVALGVPAGKQLWVSPVVSTCVTSQPTVSDGLVVVGSDVTALNASNGTVAWTHPFGTACNGGSQTPWMPAVSHGRVYAGLYSGIAALNLTTGALVWKNSSVRAVIDPLSLADHVVIGDGYPRSKHHPALYGLNQATGATEWESTTDPGPATVATFGSLSWGMAGGPSITQAVALDPLTGTQAYASASFTEYEQNLAPVVAAGHVFVNTDYELICLALPSGD